jgi:hypothetical protein
LLFVKLSFASLSCLFATGLSGLSNVARIVALLDVFSRLPVSGILTVMTAFPVVPVHEQTKKKITGIASGRSFPLAFGMYTLRTGEALYRPAVSSPSVHPDLFHALVEDPYATAIPSHPDFAAN